MSDLSVLEFFQFLRKFLNVIHSSALTEQTSTVWIVESSDTVVPMGSGIQGERVFVSFCEFIDVACIRSKTGNRLTCLTA